MTFIVGINILFQLKVLNKWGHLMSELQIDVVDLLREQFPNGSHPLVNRHTGESLRRNIEEKLLQSPQATIAYLDFSRVEVIDFSCADEVVAKLVARLVGGEYGDRYIVLQNISESHKENIEVALERKRLAVLGKQKGADWEILGVLNNYLRETLDFVVKQCEVTARQMAEILHIELNTSGTRLLNLYKARLVVREERTMSPAGRQFVYRPILSSPA